jgi:hypothetical protein
MFNQLQSRRLLNKGNCGFGSSHAHPRDYYERDTVGSLVAGSAPPLLIMRACDEEVNTH